METLNITMQDRDVNTTEFRLTDGQKLAGVTSATIHLNYDRVPTVRIELSALSELSLDGVASNVFVLTEEEMRGVIAYVTGSNPEDVIPGDLTAVRNVLNDMRGGRE